MISGPILGLTASIRVTVTVTGGPSAVEFKDMPRHKKNPAVGTKRTAYASTIILDQQDAQTFGNNEEVMASIVHEISEVVTTACFCRLH